MKVGRFFILNMSLSMILRIMIWYLFVYEMQKWAEMG